jgi:hypothetical protein
MQFFLWLESTGVSTWMRESPSLLAFPFILFLHTLGLAMLAGISTAFAIWILRFADSYPIAPMQQYFPIMWIGLAINTVSGLLLLAAYPAKALTNPVFYAKIIAIMIALVVVQKLRKRLFLESNPHETFIASKHVSQAAGLLIALWVVATVTGRFLAYTHNILMASDAALY